MQQKAPYIEKSKNTINSQLPTLRTNYWRNLTKDTKPVLSFSVFATVYRNLSANISKTLSTKPLHIPIFYIFAFSTKNNTGQRV